MNFSEVPLAICGFAGCIVIETNVTFDTVRVVDCVVVPHVALIVVVPVAKLVASPVLSIVATVAFEELHSTRGVTSCCELSLNVPIALNCFTAPTGICESRGAMVNDVRTALVTVAEAVAEIPPETTDIVEAPGPAPVASPFWSMVSTLVVLDDHCAEVSTWVLPSSKFPVAVNCCWVPVASVAVAGVSVIVWRCAGTTVITDQSVYAPTVAVMVVVPAAIVFARPLLSTVATLIDEELQVTPLTRSWIDPSL